MEIIEKQIEKVKEVPAECYNNGWGYGHRYASKGVAGTGLGLGIAGTALGLLALSRNRGFNLFGNGGNTPENVNINTLGTTSGYSVCGPTAFQAWEKGCEDTLALQKGLYEQALNQQAQRFADRQVLDAELFSVWKGQVDADFSLYKGYRDGFDIVTAKQNADAFGLYKSQRDADDALAARISALETKQAINDAVDPWRAKVLDMQIKGVAANAQAGIQLEAERRCCADNKIVNYVNSTFYPIEVADVTVGTTATARTIFNPLCNCCGSCNYGII